MQASSSFEPFADRLRRFARDMRLPLVISHARLPTSPVEPGRAGRGSALRRLGFALVGPRHARWRRCGVWRIAPGGRLCGGVCGFARLGVDGVRLHGLTAHDRRVLRLARQHHVGEFVLVLVLRVRGGLDHDADNGFVIIADLPKRVRRANLRETVWITLRDSWKLKGDLRSIDAKRLTRALFRYCIAIAHAPQYEIDHKDSLAQDWPHIPLSKEKAQFDEIVGLGEQVSRLLDPLADATSVIKGNLGKDTKTLGVVHRIGGGNVSESDLLVEYSYYGAATGRWDQRPVKEAEAQRPEWGDVTGDLYLNELVFISHVPAEIWRYELGGYPVIKKWLGYRQASRRNGAPLNLQELDQLRQIVHRIATLLTLRPLLDAAYEKASAQAWLVDDFQAEPSSATPELKGA